MTTVPMEPEAFAAALRAFHATRDGAMRADFARSLPFGELVVDRWARARALGFGDGASVYDSALVLGDVRVGAGTWIGPHVVLDGSGGLVIGDTCSISAGVQVYTHDSVRWALSGGTAPYERAPVVIGDRCYVGPQAVITRGVTIGECAVVGAQALVNRDVPAYAIVVGTPARVVGTVEVQADGRIALRWHERAAAA